MVPTEKILWVVNYDTLGDFVAKATEVGATGVAIRTDNDLPTAIPVFHDEGIKVYGWRWPSASQVRAMTEADTVAKLLVKGLDGYFVDAEGQQGASYDWNQKGLANLADEFCKCITDAAAGRLFGITSHCHASSVYPELPWTIFFNHSSVLLPQAYWRSTAGMIGGGIPADNYDAAIDSWVTSGGNRAKIVPMAGELSVSTAAEIAAYAAAATARNIGTLHFYCYDTAVAAPVWDAVKAA